MKWAVEGRSGTAHGGRGVMDANRVALWRVIEWAHDANETFLAWRNRPGEKFQSNCRIDDFSEESAIRLGAKPIALFPENIVYRMVKDYPAFYVDEEKPRVFVRLASGNEWLPIRLDDGTTGPVRRVLDLANDQDIPPERVLILSLSEPNGG